MRWVKDDYRLEEGAHAVDLDVVHDLLRRSYWASERTREQIARTVEHSTCFSLFAGDRQVGFFRALSDEGAYTYLMDFVVDDAHQGRGLGAWALGVILGRFAGTRFILVTKDAQELYRRAGFETHPFECMIRR